MDRWQLWRRVWFRMNRKTHSRRQYQVATRTRSDPEGRRTQPQPLPARYLLGPQHFVFVSNVASGMTQRPKMLLDVDCSELLTGGSEDYENFSSTCWLEDHLHRFGQPSPSHAVPPTSAVPSRTVPGSYEFHGITELEASRASPDPDDSYEEYSDDSDEEAEEDTPGVSSDVRWSPTPAGNSNGNVINLHRFPYVDHEASVPEPPPYEDEPPPTYEEAIAGDGDIRDPDGTDFLW